MTMMMGVSAKSRTLKSQRQRSRGELELQSVQSRGSETMQRAATHIATHTATARTQVDNSVVENLNYKNYDVIE